MSARSSKWLGAAALAWVFALSVASSEAQPRDPASRNRLPPLPNLLGPAPFNPTGRAPFNPTGPAPFNPTGPAPLNPTGRAPLNPTGPAPFNPTGPAPFNPTGGAPFDPTGPAPFEATGPAPFDPTGPAPFNPTGPAPFNPTGPAPFNPTGPAPVNPTGEAAEDGTGPDPFEPNAGIVEVVDDRGSPEPVARSFFCAAHGRGFASQDSFGAHLGREHGLGFSAVSDSLIDDGGVWVLPAQ